MFAHPWLFFPPHSRPPKRVFVPSCSPLRSTESEADSEGNASKAFARARMPLISFMKKPLDTLMNSHVEICSSQDSSAGAFDCFLPTMTVAFSLRVGSFPTMTACPPQLPPFSKSTTLSAFLSDHSGEFSCSHNWPIPLVVSLAPNFRSSRLLTPFQLLQPHLSMFP